MSIEVGFNVRLGSCSGSARVLDGMARSLYSMRKAQSTIPMPSTDHFEGGFPGTTWWKRLQS
jgi:hypothetical protein